MHDEGVGSGFQHLSRRDESKAYVWREKLSLETCSPTDTQKVRARQRAQATPDGLPEVSHRDSQGLEEKAVCPDPVLDRHASSVTNSG